MFVFSTLYIIYIPLQLLEDLEADKFSEVLFQLNDYIKTAPVNCLDSNAASNDDKSVDEGNNESPKLNAVCERNLLNSLNASDFVSIFNSVGNSDVENISVENNYCLSDISARLEIIDNESVERDVGAEISATEGIAVSETISPVVAVLSSTSPADTSSDASVAAGSTNGFAATPTASVPSAAMLDASSAPPTSVSPAPRDAISPSTSHTSGGVEPASSTPFPGASPAAAAAIIATPSGEGVDDDFVAKCSSSCRRTRSVLRRLPAIPANVSSSNQVHDYVVGLLDLLTAMKYKERRKFMAKHQNGCWYREESSALNVLIAINY